MCTNLGEMYEHIVGIKKQVESEAKLNKNGKKGKVGSCENGSKERGRSRHCDEELFAYSKYVNHLSSH